MDRDAALRIADQLVEAMRPYCERVEVAGSIRRGNPEVKDIEIVAVPIWQCAPVEEQVRDLFGSPPKAPENFNLLHFWAMNQSTVKWIKPGTSEIIVWQPKPEGKYWRGLINEEIKLDLFIAHRDNFGLIFVIRTGSKDFTKALVTHAKRMGNPSVEGWLRQSNGEPFVTKEERDVFDLLRLSYIEPRMRIDGRSVQIAGGNY